MFSILKKIGGSEILACQHRLKHSRSMPLPNKLNQCFNCAHALWFLAVQKDLL